MPLSSLTSTSSESMAAERGRPPHREPASIVSPARGLADLTSLLAQACDAPAALLAIPQPNDDWRPIGFGFDSQEGLGDRRLFNLLAASDEPVEVHDLLTGRLAGTPLAQRPHLMQWVYGRALRDGLGAVIAVVIVLDRQSRRATRRDHEAMAAAARRLVDTLADLPRSAGPKATSELTVDSYSPPAGIPNRKQHGLMLTNEVAQAFDVTRRTVINWAAAGKLPSTRTLGGHLRFRTDDILKLLG